jgi:histidine triad (HIT) family protein
MTKVDCIFCSIISNKIPSNKIFEDERTLAILDRNPVSKGHTLLIPKVHDTRVENLSSEEGKAIFSTLIRIIGPILRVVNADASTIGINDGVDAGQVVPHVHLHIIPRFKNDGGGSIHSVMNKRYIPESIELGEIAERIRNIIYDLK